MTTLYANLRLRPTRIGFLVPPNDLSLVRKVAQICSGLWGGSSNPIIPVGKSVPVQWRRDYGSQTKAHTLARDYIDFFEPDIYVEAEPGLAARAGVVPFNLGYQQSNVWSMESILEDGEEGVDGLPSLSVYQLYKYLYEKEYKFVARNGHSTAIFRAEDSVNQGFIDVVAGSFPVTGPLRHLDSWYVSAFDPKVLDVDAATWGSLGGEKLPLSFTSYGVERGPHGGFQEPIIFFCDPASSLDLIDLWNLRIYGRQIYPININWIDTLAQQVRGIVEGNYRPFHGNSQGMMHHTVLQFGRSIGEKRAKEMMLSAGLADLPGGAVSYKYWYDSLGRQQQGVMSSGPRRPQIFASSKHVDLPVSEEGQYRSVQFDGLQPEFLGNYYGGPSGWVNVLDFTIFRSHSSLALALPKDYSPDRTRHLHSSSSLLVSREGFVLLQGGKGIACRLNIMSSSDAMIDWLKQRGLVAEPSDAGKVARQVLDALQDLWAVKLFADRQTVELLDKMAKSEKSYKDGTVEEFQDRTAPVADWVAIISRRSKGVWSFGIELDKFVEFNILKLGLTIRCTHCSSPTWFGIRDLDEVLLCDRCRKQFKFPQGGLPFKNSPWRYRVVGPFALPGYAQGAYTTALVFRVFGEGVADAAIVPSTGLNIVATGGRKIEVDFAIWYRAARYHDDDEVVPIFGESKSFGKICFHRDDVSRMRVIAEEVPGAFIVFAALKDSLHADEIKEIRKLAEWGRKPLRSGRPRAPVVVLTGAELFSPWLIGETWKELGGKRAEIGNSAHTRLDNLWSLADATQQVYLGMTSGSEARLATAMKLKGSKQAKGAS